MIRWTITLLALCSISTQSQAQGIQQPNWPPSPLQQQQEHTVMYSYPGVPEDILQQATGMFPFASQNQERIQFIQRAMALRAGAITSTTVTTTGPR